MQGRSVDAQQMFTAATLMCFVWLAALTMLVRQVQFAEFAGYRAPLTSGQSLAFLPTFHLLTISRRIPAISGRPNGRLRLQTAWANARTVAHQLDVPPGAFAHPTKLGDRETSIAFRWR